MNTDKKIIIGLVSLLVVSVICIFVGVLAEIDQLMIYGGFAALGLFLAILLFCKIIVDKVNEFNLKLNYKVEQYISDGSYNDCIEFLKRERNNTIFTYSILNCDLNLVMINLMKDDMEEAKAIIDKHKNYNWKNWTMYYTILIMLDLDYVDEAFEQAKIFYKVKGDVFNTQKSICNKLTTIIHKGSVDVVDKIDSPFPVVKRIIKKYTN